MARAERDPGDLRRQAVELEELIARGKAALGRTTASPVNGVVHSMMLHEAMLAVLVEADRPLSVRDLAAEINKRHLHEMRDGRPVEASQVHARLRIYEHLYERGDGVVAPSHDYRTSSDEATGAFTEGLSLLRAVSLVARGRFAAGARDVAVLTSFGWREVPDSDE